MSARSPSSVVNYLTSIPNDSSFRSSASVLIRASKALVSVSFASPGFLACTNGRILCTSFSFNASILHISLVDDEVTWKAHLACFSASCFFSRASSCAFCSGDIFGLPFLSLL